MQQGIRNIGELVAYFKRRAAEHTHVNYFIFGDEENTLTDQRAKIGYPAFLLEIPSSSTEGESDQFKTVYNVVFHLVAFLERGKWDRRLYLWNQLETIAREYIQLISRDFGINFDAFSIEPVHGYTHDNLHGWQVSFALPTYQDNCFDNFVENNNTFFSTFEYTNTPTNDNGFNLALSITTEDYNADTWTAEWSAKIDGKAVEFTEPLVGNGKLLEVELNLTNAEGYTASAQAFIEPYAYSGESVSI